MSAKPSPPDNADPGGMNASARPAELEDWLNYYIYHPLSERLAAILARTPITPNAVSILAGGCVLGAAYVYATTSGTLYAALALFLLMVWHVLDGADGDLARLTGQVSELGELIDGLSDYVSHVVLYCTLAALVWPDWGWIGAFTMFIAGVARGFQAVFYETQRRQYMRWVYAKAWLGNTLEPQERAEESLGPVKRVYLAIARGFSSGGERLDRIVAGLAPDQKTAATGLIKQRILPTIQQLSPLSSNYRTLVLGGAMILQLPIAIIIFELFLLTGLTLLCMRTTRRAIAEVADQLEAISER